MAIDSAIELIMRWDDPTMSDKFVFDRFLHKIKYLEAVDEVQLAIDSAISSDDQSRPRTVIELAITRLADEFRNILKLKCKSRQPHDNSTADTVSSMTDTSSLGTYQVYEDDDDDAYSFTMTEQAITDIRHIVVRMNSAGYLGECIKAYSTERKSFISSQFQRLNIPKLEKDRVRKVDDETFGMMVKLWVKSFNVCFKYLFANEKQLRWSIFRDFGNDTEGACFIETIKDPSTQLFNFAKELGFVHSSFDRILQFYNIFYSHLPEINKLFYPKSSDEFFESVGGSQALAEVGDAVKYKLLEFENALYHHQARVHLVNQLHSMVCYVMRYMSTLAQHNETLTRLSLHKPPSSCKMDSISDNMLSHHATWILSCLVSNLEGNAKLHKDASTSLFFFMNNVHFVIEKIKRLTGVKGMVGDVYFMELVDKYNHAKAKYLSLIFDKLLHYLRDDEPNCYEICSSRASRLKLKLKSFNAKFAKVHRHLPRLGVTDNGLQVDLREAVRTKLVPAYASFLEHVESLPVLQKYVKYSIKELETAIFGLFMYDHIILEV